MGEMPSMPLLRGERPKRMQPFEDMIFILYYRYLFGLNPGIPAILTGILPIAAPAAIEVVDPIPRLHPHHELSMFIAQLPFDTQAQRRAMGERGRAFVLDHHTYPVLAQRFLQALDSVPAAMEHRA